MKKIAFITTLQPATHYSRYLVGALQKIKGGPARRSLDEGGPEVLIWADNNPKNRTVTLKNVVPLWDPKGNYLDQILAVARKANPDLVHIQHEINMFGGARRALKFPNLPRALREEVFKVVITFHAVVATADINPDFLTAFSLPKIKPLVWLIRAGFSRLYRASAQAADQIIVHSPVSKKVLIADYGISSDKITVIPIGIPQKQTGIKPIQPKNLNLPKNARVLLYFGYLIRRKGLEYLIDGFDRAAKKYPNLHLVLAGGTLDYQKDYPKELQARIKQLPTADHFHFTGFVSEAELNLLYDRALALILPYTLSISSSLPLTFAFQHGKPVLASSIGTLRDEIRPGQDGLLFTPRSARAIAHSIGQILADPDLYQKLSTGARSNLTTRSWDKIADKTLALYKKTLK